MQNRDGVENRQILSVLSASIWTSLPGSPNLKRREAREWAILKPGPMWECHAQIGGRLRRFQGLYALSSFGDRSLLLEVGSTRRSRRRGIAILKPLWESHRKKRPAGSPARFRREAMLRPLLPPEARLQPAAAAWPASAGPRRAHLQCGWRSARPRPPSSPGSGLLPRSGDSPRAG